MATTFLLVDYENVTEIQSSILQIPSDWHVRVFVGRRQKQIPSELVQITQPLGNRLQWIQVEGEGPNNLDFHLAFYLGRLSTECAGRKFLILSKDKGFAPLLKHLGTIGVKCARVESLPGVAGALVKEAPVVKVHAAKPLVEVPGTKAPAKKEKEPWERAYDLLAGNKLARPKTLKALKDYLYSNFQKKMPEPTIQEIINTLKSKGMILDSGKKLEYRL